MARIAMVDQRATCGLSGSVPTTLCDGDQRQRFRVLGITQLWKQQQVRLPARILEPRSGCRSEHRKDPDLKSLHGDPVSTRSSQTRRNVPPQHKNRTSCLVSTVRHLRPVRLVPLGKKERNELIDGARLSAGEQKEKKMSGCCNSTPLSKTEPTDDQWASLRCTLYEKICANTRSLSFMKRIGG